jgi:hypothetical protein
MSMPPKLVKCHPAPKNVDTLLTDGCGNDRTSEGKNCGDSWLSRIALIKKETRLVIRKSNIEVIEVGNPTELEQGATIIEEK